MGCLRLSQSLSEHSLLKIDNPEYIVFVAVSFGMVSSAVSIRCVQLRNTTEIFARSPVKVGKHTTTICDVITHFIGINICLWKFMNFVVKPGAEFPFFR